MTEPNVSARPRSARLSVGKLLLDPENPRLVFAHTPTQADLAKRLYEDESLDELMPSLRDNGFFEEEPLVVIPSAGAGGEWICVEGNRRLATVKLLVDSQLRKPAGVKDWPVLMGESLERLKTVPVVIYPSRDDVLPFLGFRHITGAKKWEPFQKARFIARLVQDGRSITEIQDLIGDTTQTVKRLYQDFEVYRQIDEELPGSARSVRRRFSLLEVTLNQRLIKAHLGMPKRLPAEAIQENLIPDEKVDELKRIVDWVFGSETRIPVISDSRDIGKLGTIVADEEALGHLIRSGDLEGAFEFAGGEREYLLRRLGRAERMISDAVAIAAQYSDDEDIRRAAARVQRAAEGLAKVVS